MKAGKNHKVLVFPCGTEIGLEIQRSLGRSAHIELFGANSVEPNHGAFVFRRRLPLLPLVYDPLFLPEIAAHVRNYEIDFIYPAHDDVLLHLSRHADTLGCDIIGSPRETCELCRSKSATYARFAGLLPVPRLYSPNDKNVSFPVFLKPDKGQGSRGVKTVHSSEAWETALKEDPTLLAMEYLPGTEYTVDCFTDRHGNLRFAGARERVRTQGGISVHTCPVRDVFLEKSANIINNTLGMRGAWFFQMKRDSRGQAVLLEIASRVSGGMGLYRNLGVNLPLLSIFDRLGQDVDIVCNQYDIAMDRALTARFSLNIAYDHVYIDLDDTLVHASGVDALLVAFLFQCRNQDKKLHLLTRHAGDVAETLARHALTSLFHTTASVSPGECKSEHIQHKAAIFIDDSFEERRRVHEQTGIPVFAPDAVESLLDWRC